MKNNKRNSCGLDSTKLLKIATINGARSLKLEHKVGQFKVGYQFDFVSFNVKDEKLHHFEDKTHILDALVFAGGNQEINSVGVGGVGQFY